MNKFDCVDHTPKQRKGFIARAWHFLFEAQDVGESIFEAVMAGILSIAVIVLLIFIAYMAG